MNTTLSTGLGLLTALTLSTALAAQDEVADALRAQRFRALGPANFSGRVVDVEAVPGKSTHFYVVTATGGLWKTVNNGTSFESIFDQSTVFALGDLAIAPSNPEVLYLGTGEANNQRSSYHGNGVWKSTDGGETWSHVGLEKTEHIGRIVVHPNDPNTAYVAALGALYSPNRDRGLYKTTDGGENWEMSKWINEDTGFVDVALSPTAPDTILAASYDRRRRAWDFRESGPGSGVWRSADGGESWDRCGDIPDGEIGRIGVAMSLSSGACYAIVENRNPVGEAIQIEDIGEERAPQASVDPELYPFGEQEESEAPGAAAAPQRTGGQMYRSDDRGESWQLVSETKVGGTPHYYYGQVRIDPNNDDHVWALGVRVYESTDGGRTFETGFGRGLHVDHHALWIDPADSQRALLGNDGGLALTYDGGQHWEVFDSLNLGQFYAIGVDERYPYNVYGGTQDNGSWAVPSEPLTSQPISNRHSVKVGGGDGFYVVVDPENPNLIYAESQFGGMRRLDLATGRSISARPGSRRGQARLRFNWMTPMVLDPNDQRTMYAGSQFVHRSRDRGETWERISPDLSSNDPDRLEGDVPHCTVTTIAASSQRSGLLFAGTDDGRVWRTSDDGEHWTELTDRIEGVPERLWISRIETSPHDADRVYVSITGYREDLREPYLFLSTDGGETFDSIVNDLAHQTENENRAINVVREHPRNPNCVLVGTESGVFCSIDEGSSWHAFGSNLPTVPVHDLLVHPREPDVVIGTHGRGLFAATAPILESIGGEATFAPLTAFPVVSTYAKEREYSSIRYPGARGFRADSKPTLPSFDYWVGQDSDGKVRVEVHDISGRRFFRGEGDATAGFHRVRWTTGRGRRGNGNRRPPVGRYRATFRLGDQELVHMFEVRELPSPVGAQTTTDESFETNEEEQGDAIH
ncbi:MAG: hypothetical protein AAF196_16175 [Planctomycetota bacterium]